MESTAFFEKKINLTPNEFNQVKNESIESLLEKKAKLLIENKCSEQGFVLPGTIKLLSRSMGYFESARFTGDAVYYVKLEGKIVYPADGIRVIGQVIRKNKMGLYVDYQKAVRIQVPRDLHIGSEEYEDVEVGDNIEVELKRSKFQINDPFILASATFIEKKTDSTLPNAITEITSKDSPDSVDYAVDAVDSVDAVDAVDAVNDDDSVDDDAVDDDDDDDEVNAVDDEGI